MASSNWKRFWACSCSHGAFIHQGHAAAALEHKAAWKPHTTVHLGDAFDCTCLRGGADPHDQDVSLAEDIACGKRFLEDLRPDVFLMGNHEARLWRVSKQQRGVVGQLAEAGIADITGFLGRIKCGWLPYHVRKGVFELGNTKLLHGYAIGIGAVRKHAAIYGRCVFGHLHRVEEAPAQRFDDGTLAVTIGWLGDPERLDYSDTRPTILNWEPSWCYGYVNERTGSTVWWLARCIDGEWLLPEGVKHV